MAARAQRCCGVCRAPLPAPPPGGGRCAACGAPAPWLAPFAQPSGHPRGGVTRERAVLWPVVAQHLAGVHADIPQELRFPSGFRKRALLIGITYRKSWWHPLKGPLNDVKCMSYLLQTKFRFPEQCIIVLTDEENNDASRMPTRANMEAAMRSLVKDCQPGDSLVFHFSGHGFWQKDENGDEVDGYDEVLCPMDYKAMGSIVDDWVHEWMVRPLPTGVTLHAIVDASHSGSALDLPFVYSMGRNGKNEWKEYSKSDRSTSGGWAICFSSCEDDQTSSETTAFAPDNTTTGVMTYCFIAAVQNQPEITYDHLLRQMDKTIRQRGPLRRRFSQVTQLSSSKKFDVQTPLALKSEY